MFTKNKSMLALLAFASVFPTQATTVIDQAVETRGSDIPARPTKYIKTLKKSSSGQSTQAQKFAFSSMATASASGSDASQSKVMSELALSRIGVNEEITPETTELFGDKVDLSSGGISLSNTDVSIPGNFPIDVGVQRVYRGTQYSEGQLLHFADWQLDIPAITTTVVDGTPLTNTWTNGKPCSGSLNPGSIQTSDGYAVSQQFWSGDFISVPGAGTERLLEPTTATPGVTRIAKGWKIECVIVGNQEGFKATNSKGITYTFSKLRLVPAEDIEVSVTDPETKAQWSIRVPRYNAFMQVTQINDRFGNTVNYNYSSPDQLDSITTSDGRTVSFAYELGVERKRIRSITANGQTWQYFYRQSSTPKWINNNYVYPDQLSRVVLPDGREWTYNVDFAPVDALKVQTTLYTGEDKITGERQCSFTNSSTSIGSEAVSTYTSSIKHPNGMVATFEVKPTLFGRSKLPKLMKSATVPLNQYPRCFANFAISKKTLSGKGVPTLTWNYSYSQNPGQYVDGSGDQGPAPAGLSGLPVVPAGYVAMDLKSTTVVSPDGAKTVHVFDRSYTFKQDQEVATFQYDTDGITLLQRAEHSYAVMSTGGTANMFTQKYLGNAAPGGGFVFENEALYNNYANKSESKIVNYVAGVPSDTYTTQLSNYNSYGVPGLTKEFNSFSSKVKFTRDTYIHDLNNFVLNLLQKKEISADGSSYTAVAETTYHSASSAAKSLPNQQYSFGQLVSTTSYHPDGNVKQQTFNVANRWIYLDNYKRGKPQTIRIPRRYDAYCTDPVSCYEEIRATINDTGTIAWTRDLNGNETYYSYDVVGRLTTIAPYDARWSDTSISYSLDYSTSAALIQTIARGDYRKTVTLDGLMRPILTKEWDVNNESGTASYVRREFNAYNKPTFESVPSEVGYESVGSSTIFDGLQRLKSQTNTPNGDLSFSYLANNSVRVTNGRGYATTTQYLAYGSATQEAPVKITQPESVTTDITYNIFDNVTAITQGGITENRLYNAQQLMCLQKRPETGIKAMTYNAVGEITQYAEGLTGNGTTCSDYGSNASAWVSIGYDNQGAQKSINFADGTAAVNYTLDAQGNLKNLTNGTVAWDYDYNSKNLVEWERLSIDGKQFTVDATYNALGFVSSEQLSNELTLSYIVNARGQVTQVSDGATLLASGATYYPNGQLKSFNYGNAMVFSQTLDAKKRPYERIVSRYGTNQLAQRYQYDVNDNVTAITDLVNAGSSVGMSYDGLDRLSTANGAWGNGSFSYDVLSNIKTKTVAGTTYSYTYDTTKNRLASVTGGYSFGYDDRGNVTNNGKRGFSFNRANQLVQSASVSYVYDGYNRRVRQSNASGNHYSVYDAKGTLKQRLTSANTRVYSVYLGKQLIAERELSASSNTTRYQHTDVLGSVVGESDSAAALTRSVYQPFGERLGGQKSGVGFTGHLEDPDVGLTYMQQRYYDPVIGRFYSNDPVGFSADKPMMFNRYAYSNNNPYKFNDPDGRLPVFIPAIAGFVVKEIGAEVASQATGGATDFLSVRRMATNGLKHVAMAQGRASEARILKKMGLEKNNETVSTTEGNSVPDALTDTMSVEVKDVKNISLTKQLRIQTQAAKAAGKTSVLVVTDKNEKVSGPAKEAFDVIIKEKDLK